MGQAVGAPKHWEILKGALYIKQAPIHKDFSRTPLRLPSFLNLEAPFRRSVPLKGSLNNNSPAKKQASIRNLGRFAKRDALTMKQQAVRIKSTGLRLAQAYVECPSLPTYIFVQGPHGIMQPFEPFGNSPWILLDPVK